MTLAALVATLIAGALAAAFLLVGAAKAEGVPRCMPYPTMLKVMANMGQTRAGAGLDARGFVVELYAAPDGRFVVLSRGTNGMSCVEAIGGGWESEKPAEPEKES